jgi:cell division protein FtsQ
MHQLIGKKKSLILYFFFLVALSTTTNKTLYKTENLFQIDNINITGIPLDNIEGLNDELYKTIEKNIFFLKKEVLKNSISEFNIVEKYSVKKIYPRELNINIKPTKFIAKISNKDDVLVGSNGKLISNKDFKKNCLAYLVNLILINF